MTPWMRRVAVLAVAAAVAVSLVSPAATRVWREGIGTLDFVIYWSAFQIFADGGDPYDLATLNEVKDRSGIRYRSDLPFRAPPWTLTLLLPLLAWRFEASATLLLLSHAVLVPSIAGLAWATFATVPASTAQKVLAALCVLPLVNLVQSGNLGLVVTAGVAGCFWALARRRDVLAGAFFVSTALKPHLFLPLLAALLLWTFRTRRWAWVVSCGAGVALAAALAYAISPAVFAQWIGGRASAQLFETPTLANAVANAVGAATGTKPAWPVTVIPLAGVAVTLLWFARREIVWERHLPPLLCWSLVTAPYAWLHDDVLLMIPQVALVAAALRGTATAQRAVVGMLVAFHALTGMLSGAPPKDVATTLGGGATSQHHYFWYPLAFWVVWRVGRALVEHARVPAPPPVTASAP
jgi:hypothetical protein